MTHAQHQRERGEVLHAVPNTAVPFETPFAVIDGIKFKAPDLVHG